MATKQLFNTEEGLRSLKEELDFLKNHKRQEVKENLAIARSFGDLSENSEYDEARNEQAKVEARIAELEQIILHTSVVDESGLDHSTAHLGSTVRLTDLSTGKEQDLRPLSHRRRADRQASGRRGLHPYAEGREKDEDP